MNFAEMPRIPPELLLLTRYLPQRASLDPVREAVADEKIPRSGTNGPKGVSESRR